jgi:hypothetical protein
VNISLENKKWLIENVQNTNSLFQSDVNTLLSALNDVIIERGLDDEGDYNAFGLKAQSVYDDIYEFA